MGNWLYGKIEPKSRKNDGFMALVHAMVILDKLPTQNPKKTRDKYKNLDVVTG